MPCTLTSMCQHVTNNNVKSQLERREIVRCPPEFEVKVASASKMQLCILAQHGCNMHGMQSVSCMAVCPACKYPKQADSGGVGVRGGPQGAQAGSPRFPLGFCTFRSSGASRGMLAWCQHLCLLQPSSAPMMFLDQSSTTVQNLRCRNPTLPWVMSYTTWASAKLIRRHCKVQVSSKGLKRPSLCQSRIMQCCMAMERPPVLSCNTAWP